jgi:hypothetical protein
MGAIAQAFSTRSAIQESFLPAHPVTPWTTSLKVGILHAACVG